MARSREQPGLGKREDPFESAIRTGTRFMECWLQNDSRDR